MFDSMPLVGAAVNTIMKLWVNGKAVKAVTATLEVDPGRQGWRVRARLGRYSPFRQRFGLSMQLSDGRTAHGRAVLVEADGEDVVFEGDDFLEGGAAEDGEGAAEVGGGAANGGAANGGATGGSAGAGGATSGDADGPGGEAIERGRCADGSDENGGAEGVT